MKKVNFLKWAKEFIQDKRVTSGEKSSMTRFVNFMKLYDSEFLKDATITDMINVWHSITVSYHRVKESNHYKNFIGDKAMLMVIDKLLFEYTSMENREVEREPSNAHCYLEIEGMVTRIDKSGDVRWMITGGSDTAKMVVKVEFPA